MAELVEAEPVEAKPAESSSQPLAELVEAKPIETKPGKHQLIDKPEEKQCSLKFPSPSAPQKPSENFYSCVDPAISDMMNLQRSHNQLITTTE